MRIVIVVLLFSAVFLSNAVKAGALEDGLLASSALRLDVKGVDIALRKGAKVDQVIPHPDSPTITKTPVQFAMRGLIDKEIPDAPQRAERILRSLFKAGAKLTGDRDELFPPICYGHDRIVTLLLENGANPHTRIYGYTPAELAIKYNQYKLLTIFYSRGVSKVDANTAAQIRFVHASGLQNVELMRAALTDGATVDQHDPAGHVAIVELFSMPLIEPIGYDALEFLIFEAGADVGVADLSDKKDTALHLLIRRNSYRKIDFEMSSNIAELLLKRGADVSALDGFGRIPLHYAAESGNVLVMQVLIRHGTKIMVRDIFRKTPLDMAKSTEVINLLREAGARE